MVKTHIRVPCKDKHVEPKYVFGKITKTLRKSKIKKVQQCQFFSSHHNKAPDPLITLDASCVDFLRFFLEIWDPQKNKRFREIWVVLKKFL